MKRNQLAYRVMLAASLLLIGGCEGKSESAEVDAEPGRGLPAMVRARYTTELKTILRDVQMAQERASANEGHYLGLGELKSQYFTQPVREGIELSFTGVSESGYKAEIVHKASGITCHLEVSGGSRGKPRC